jgi:hypothetical protein
MPLTKVKTQPVEPRSSLKNKRESTAPESSKLPSTKHSCVTSDTLDVFSKLGSLPSLLPPLPTSQRPTRAKRHPGGKTRLSPDSKKEIPKDGTVRLDDGPHWNVGRRKILDHLMFQVIPLCYHLLLKVPPQVMFILLKKPYRKAGK